jgi:hypothetical protein
VLAVPVEKCRVDVSSLEQRAAGGARDTEVAMAMGAIVRDRFLESFELYDELAREVPDATLAMKLPGIPSNTLGSQLWCVVGARESFGEAIRSGAWPGFSCSLTAAETREREAVSSALSRSAELVLDAIDGVQRDDEDRLRFVLRLLEHEASHQGQLIRYFYGLQLAIPALWRDRYALG